MLTKTQDLQLTQESRVCMLTTSWNYVRTWSSGRSIVISPLLVMWRKNFCSDKQNFGDILSFKSSKSAVKNSQWDPCLFCFVQLLAISKSILYEGEPGWIDVPYWQMPGCCWPSVSLQQSAGGAAAGSNLSRKADTGLNSSSCSFVQTSQNFAVACTNLLPFSVYCSF